MQTLARTSTLGTSYTAHQVYQLMIAPTAQEAYRFDWLGASGLVLGDITKYVVDDQSYPQIYHDTTAAVHRTLTFQTWAGGAPKMKPLRDLVRPWYRLRAPDGGWLEWALGTYSLNAPQKYSADSATLYQWTATDLTGLLNDVQFEDAYTVKAGTNYVQAIKSVVANYGGDTPIPVRIIDYGQTLPQDLPWNAGTTYLKVVSDLLTAMNFFPPWCDEMGALRSAPIPDWNLVVPSWTWDSTQQQSIIAQDMGGTSTMSSVFWNETPDPSQAFNQIRVVGSNPQNQDPIIANYVNDNPLSPVSVPNWHPKTTVVNDSTIADQATANARAKSVAQASARIYGNVVLYTLPWPCSQDNDIYQVTYRTADEGLQSYPYLEINWRMYLYPGGANQRTIQRIVPA